MANRLICSVLKMRNYEDETRYLRSLEMEPRSMGYWRRSSKMIDDGGSEPLKNARS